jgi:uncharacterized membrane protein YgcG
MTAFPILLVTLLTGTLVWVIARARISSRKRLERATFIRQYAFPSGLKYKLDQAYPALSDAQIRQVLEGLRAWFLLIAANPSTTFGMPSKAVDTAWHEFILLTKNYAAFCDLAFGKFLHHAPHNGDVRAEQDGLASTWGGRAGLIGAGALAGGLGAASLVSARDLFEIDRSLGIPDGLVYSESDLEKFDHRHNQLTSASSSGSGDGGGSAGGCADSSGCGDGGGGGGCGGGCGS